MHWAKGERPIELGLERFLKLIGQEQIVFCVVDLIISEEVITLGSLLGFFNRLVLGVGLLILLAFLDGSFLLSLGCKGSGLSLLSNLLHLLLGFFNH